MTTTRGAEPAYPIDEFVPERSVPAGGYKMHRGGVTKRELFAAMAMHGLLASGDHKEGCAVPVRAVVYADALLAELDRTQ